MLHGADVKEIIEEPMKVGTVSLPSQYNTFIFRPLVLETLNSMWLDLLQNLKS